MACALLIAVENTWYLHAWLGYRPTGQVYHPPPGQARRYLQMSGTNTASAACIPPTGAVEQP